MRLAADVLDQSFFSCTGLRGSLLSTRVGRLEFLEDLGRYSDLSEPEMLLLEKRPRRLLKMELMCLEDLPSFLDWG